MKHLLTIATLLLAQGIFAQDKPSILDRVTESLPAHHHVSPLEKVYVQTDKDIYAPSEIIWYSAWVTSRTSFEFGNLSPELTVSLYNASGKFITGDKYQIIEGRVHADLKIADILSSGRYYLAAYTPLDMQPAEIFTRVIYIDQPYEQEARVSLANPDALYPAGSDVQIDLVVKDAFGQPADRYTFDFQASHAGKSIGAGKLRSEQGKASVQLKIPDNAGYDPITLILSHPRNLWTETVYLRTGGDKLSVMFYPEGGNVIHNVPVKMGYYAVCHGSTPVAFEADIQDNTGQVIGKSNTFVPGYGLFPFRSEPGKSYRMVITSEYGKGQYFPIPGHNPEKVALTITRQDKAFVQADITVPDQAIRTLSVAVTERLNIIWAASFEVSGTSRIRIPVDDFDPGIQQITVFDQEGKVLAKRLIYTPSEDQLHIHTDVEETGDTFKFRVESRNSENRPVPAALTIAVADRARLSNAITCLKDYFNLEAELLHPVVHIPGITGNAANMTTALDYILISNDLKSFSWENVLATGIHPELPDIQTVKGVSGSATNRRGELVRNAQINLLNTKDMQMYTTTSDENGNFIFPGFNPVDSGELSVTASDEKGRVTLSVTLAPDFSERIGEEIRKSDSRYAQQIPYRPFPPEYLTANPELVIKAPQVIRQESATSKRSRNESYKSLLQTATNLAEVIKMMKPYTITNGQIVFHGTQNSLFHQSGALIVLDGQKMGTSIDILNIIPPVDVETINISLDPMDIQKYTGFNSVGVIEITTKKGEFTKPGAIPGVPADRAEQYRNGLRLPRDFQEYRTAAGKALPATLFWDPDAATDHTGIFQFSVPRSALKSEFNIIIEGMDGKGNMGKVSSPLRKN
jgi:hypothetical protein